MKFITEEDLRDIYRKEPFTTYEIESGARLTPGARQFLADRGINMFDDELGRKKKTETKKPQTEQLEKKSNWKTKKLLSKMKSLDALFLLTGEELLTRDVILAQSVINLGKQFCSLKHIVLGQSSNESFCCQECTGMKEENFNNDLDDCFEITEFHMRLEKGKEILSLHRLRCALREVEPVVLEVYEGCEEENKLCEEIIGKTNRMINVISQLICSAVGGKECQRKN